MSSSQDSILLNIKGKKLVFDLSNIRNCVFRKELLNNQKLLTIFDYFNYYDTEEDSKLSRGKTSDTQPSSSIFGNSEDDEMKNILEDLRQAAGEDNCLDTAEAENFLHNITNLNDVSADDLMNFISVLIEKTPENSALNAPEQKTVKNNTQNNTPNKTDAEIRSDVINLLEQDSIQTLELLDMQNPGAITKIYNNVKEFFNKDLCNAKVYEAAINEAKASKYLDLVNRGELSRKEYIDANRNRLKDMIKARLYRKDKDGKDYITKNCGKGGLKPADFEKMMLAAIDYEYDHTSIEQIKNMMRQLSLANDSSDVYLLNNLKEKAIELHKRQSSSTKNGDKIMGTSFDTSGIADEGDDKPLTFEEVFAYEHGVPYNKEACEEYQNNYNNLCRQMGAYNKYISFLNAKSEITDKDDAEKALNKMVQIFESYYQYDGMPELAFNKLQNIVKQNNLPIVVKMADGKIYISVSIGSEDLMRDYVDDILNTMQKDLEERLKACVGDNPEKIIQQQGQKVDISHLKAYGGDLSSVIAKELLDDNNSFIKSGTGFFKEGGMYLASAGGMLCLTPVAPAGDTMVAVGGITAVVGIAVDGILSAIEANTREVQSDREKEDVVKDIITDAGGMIVGYFSSKLGFKQFNKIIDKKLATILRTEINSGNKAAAIKTVLSNRKTLMNFMYATGAKLSVDVVCSFLGDLVMMGVLDTNQDWEALLKANLMGAVIGSTTELSAFAKTTAQSKNVEAKKQELHKTVKRQIDNIKTKTSDYIAGKKDAVVSSFNKSKPVKAVKSTVDKSKIIAQLNLKNANAKIKAVMQKLLDYDFDYNQLKQMADILQTDNEIIAKNAKSLRQGDGVRKPELEKEFKQLPDFLDRFVNDPSFPLKELTARKGDLTELVERVLADPKFPINKLPLLLEAQISRASDAGWEASVDLIKNDGKSSLLKGDAENVNIKTVLNNLNSGYFSKTDLDFVRKLITDCDTDASVLSLLYKSTEFAVCGANLPKISNILDKTNSVQDMITLLKQLDEVNIPEKYKPQVENIKVRIKNNLTDYFQKALAKLENTSADTDIPIEDIYKTIINTYGRSMNLPVTKAGLEKLQQLKVESSRFDSTSALTRKQRAKAMNEEIYNIHEKITKFLTNRLDANIDNFLTHTLDNRLFQKLKQQMTETRINTIIKIQSKQDFSINVIEEFLKSDLDKIPNFNIQAELAEFNTKYGLEATSSNYLTKSNKVKNKNYPYFHDYLINKYNLKIPSDKKSYMEAFKSYYEYRRVHLRKYASQTDPGFEHLIEQFQNLDNIYHNDNKNVEARIKIYEDISRYLQGTKYDINGALETVKLTYTKEDLYSPSELNTYNQNLEANKARYAEHKAETIDNLKQAIKQILSALNNS